MAPVVVTSVTSRSVKCPLCGGVAAHHLFLPHTSVWKCAAPECSLEFAHPQLDDRQLARAYTDFYYPTNGNGNGHCVRFENTSDSVVHQVFQHLEKRFGTLAGLRLLDYGCGCGSLMRVSIEFGLRPTGIESDPQARSVAAKASGAAVYENLEGLCAEEPQTQFDLIVLMTVIEHLRRPWDDLARMRTLLRPRGLLFISTNDVRCLRARIRRNRWEQYLNPTHLYYFERGSLARVIRNAGFPELSEWRLNIRFPHHGLLRRWLYNSTCAVKLSDGLYYLCSKSSFRETERDASK